MHPENPPGAWYVVSPGETLEQIAARAGVPAEDILELNGLARRQRRSAGTDHLRPQRVRFAGRWAGFGRCERHTQRHRAVLLIIDVAAAIR